MKITTWDAHGVIVTAVSKEGYASAPVTLRPGGTMVVSFWAILPTFKTC